MGDEAAHHDIRRLRSEHRRIVVGADGDDHLEPLCPDALKESFKHPDVAVPYRPEADIDDRTIVEFVEPRQTWVHRDRALAAGNAGARRWESLDPAERWEAPSPNELLEISLHRERGPMVLDDLRALPTSPIIIAEGSVVPAWAVSAGVVALGHAVWLLPTPEFHARQLAARGTTRGTERLYLLLGEVIEQEAREHGVPTVIVDGSLSVDGVAQQVETRLSEALAAGPRADTTEERRQLLREINMAVVVQVRSYYARPRSDRDPETVDRLFVCECGDPTCEDDLLSTVGSVAGAPALSPRHHAT